MIIRRNTKNPRHIEIILLQLRNDRRVDDWQYKSMRRALSEEDLQELLNEGLISPEEYDIMQQAEDVRRDYVEKRLRRLIN